MDTMKVEQSFNYCLPYHKLESWMYYKLLEKENALKVESEGEHSGDLYERPVQRYCKILRQAVRPETASFCSDNEPWILRNLTTKQYVRPEAIAVDPVCIHGPFIDHIGFGHVVLLRACWSTSNVTDIRYEGNTDIAPLARHIQQPEEIEWAEVSEEVTREIATLWESEYGPYWHDKVMNTHRVQEHRTLRCWRLEAQAASSVSNVEKD